MARMARRPRGRHSQMSGLAVIRKYVRDEQRRAQQVRNLAAKQLKAQIKHWAAQDRQARETLKAEALKHWSQLARSGQTVRESLVIDVIVNEWLRMQESRYLLNRNGWTLPEFQELQRRFVEAQAEMSKGLRRLQQLRAVESPEPEVLGSPEGARNLLASR